MRINIRLWQLTMLAVSFVLMAVVMPLLALASDAFPVPVPADPAALLISIVTNWKAMGVLGIMSAATMLTSMAVNAWVPDTWKFKRLSTLLIAILYAGITAAVAPSGSAIASVLGVLVTGLIAKGGASEIYEALKGAGIIKASS